jgi:hypothetical protein
MRVTLASGEVTQPRTGLARMNVPDPGGAVALGPVVRHGGPIVINEAAPGTFDVDLAPTRRGGVVRWRGARVRGA